MKNKKTKNQTSLFAPTPVIKFSDHQCERCHSHFQVLFLLARFPGETFSRFQYLCSKCRKLTQKTNS